MCRSSAGTDRLGVLDKEILINYELWSGKNAGVNDIYSKSASPQKIFLIVLASKISKCFKNYKMYTSISASIKTYIFENAI